MFFKNKMDNTVAQSHNGTLFSRGQQISSVKSQIVSILDSMPYEFLPQLLSSIVVA